MIKMSLNMGKYTIDEGDPDKLAYLHMADQDHTPYWLCNKSQHWQFV